METKFKLTNLVLYAKGWYLRTDNIFDDLIKILELDNYTPFDKWDVYSIIIQNVQESNLYRWTDLKEILNGIHPFNCWKTGYYTKDNCEWTKTPKDQLPDYNIETAFVYYVLSNLSFIETSKWNVKIPKCTKYPRAKNITIKQLYEQFCK